MREIRDLVVYLRSLRDDLEGRAPPIEHRQKYLEQLEFEVGQLGVDELVEELDKLQRIMNIQETLPGKYVETQNLAHQLLMDQAMFLGRQVGISSAATMDEIIFLTFNQLEDWIEGFISRYTLPVLPEDFSIFGDTATGIPGMPGAMSTVGGIPMSPLIPGFMGPSQGFGQPPVAGIYPGFTSGGMTSVPGATPGSTQFIFPNVTDAPFVAAPTGGLGELQLPYIPGVPVPGVPQGAPAGFPFTTPLPPTDGQGFMPGFGQMMGLPPSLIETMFQPGAFMPMDPSAGFDVAAWNMLLEDQIASQLAAELVRRGEIDDTAAFALLIQEKQVLATEALLADEVVAYAETSQAEIDLLEQTIASHEEALRTLREDPALAAEAEAVENALAILESALERKRTQLAAQAAALIEEEVTSVIDAETEKQDAVGGTLATVEEVAEQRVQATERGLIREFNLTGAAASDQLGITKELVKDEDEVKDTQRLEEAEAELEHAEARKEFMTEENEEALETLHRFWQMWMTAQWDAFQDDLDALAEWVQLRQLLFDEAGSTWPSILPPLPGVGGDGDGDGDGGLPDNRIELENLARHLGQQIGMNIGEINSMIIDMTMQELIDFVLWLQDQVDPSPYALGGGFGPGQTMLVGEQGPEIVRFNAAGVVDPLRAAMFRNMPALGMGGTTNIDRSVNMGGFSFPDPRGIPPVYIEMMKNIAHGVVKKSWTED
jgi:hypothetical protein